MSAVTDRLSIGEVRESADGMRRLGVETWWPPEVPYVQAVCVAFRLGKDRPWMPATAGGFDVLTRETWESWPLVAGEEGSSGTRSVH